MQGRVLYGLFLGISILFWGCKGKDSHQIEKVQEEGINHSSALAIIRANKAIENDPQNPSLYFERAQLFYDFGSFDEGILDAEQAIELGGNQPEYYHLLADLQLDHYQSGQALTTLEAAIARFPEHMGLNTSSRSWRSAATGASRSRSSTAASSATSTAWSRACRAGCWKWARPRRPTCLRFPMIS